MQSTGADGPGGATPSGISGRALKRAGSPLRSGKMSKRTYALMLGLALVLLTGSAGIVKAQIPDNEVLKAEIPFSFVVRDKTYPAGEYTIRQTPEGADSEFVLELSSDHGKMRSTLFETFSAIADRVPQYSKIEFDKVGGKYFLSKIFVADSPDGNEVPKSAMEKKLGKSAATDSYVLNVDRWKVVEKAPRAADRNGK
jgi:hypothetical protein